MSNESDRLADEARSAIRAEVRSYTARILVPVGVLGFVLSAVAGYVVHDVAIRSAEAEFIKENYQAALETAAKAEAAIRDAQQLTNSSRSLLDEAQRIKATIDATKALTDGEAFVNQAKESLALEAKKQLDQMIKQVPFKWTDVTSFTTPFEPGCIYRARLNNPANTPDIVSLLSGVGLDGGTFVFDVVTPNTLAINFGNPNDVGRLTIPYNQRSTLSIRSRSLASDYQVRSLEQLCV